MKKCPICKEFVCSFESHKCPPKWKVWIEDQGEEESSDIYALFSSSAAEKFAEKEDAYDNPYIAGEGETITVIVVGKDGIKKKYNVIGEFNPSYYANEEEIEENLD